MTRPLRLDLIYSKVRELKDSLSYVEEYLPSEFRFLNSRKDKNALYKETEFAIQLMIDICSIINADIGRLTPSDEDSIIDSVVKEKVLSERLGKVLHEMKGFRNVLVHKYDTIDDSKAYESIYSGLKDFDIFIIEIEKFLEKHKKRNEKSS